MDGIKENNSMTPGHQYKITKKNEGIIGFKTKTTGKLYYIGVSKKNENGKGSEYLHNNNGEPITGFACFTKSPIKENYNDCEESIPVTKNILELDGNPYISITTPIIIKGGGSKKSKKQRKSKTTKKRKSRRRG
jgi:hypothetical protein